jgi:iron complex outermembrane receptor protein
MNCAGIKILRFFLSSAMLHLAGILSLLLAFRSSVTAQDRERPYTLDPVVVTASRIPHKLSKTAQPFTIIRREDIAALPVHSIPGLLKTVSGIDIRRRGPHGVQADVGIRGSSFEQTLIMVDGVSVTDSQTGHHNLDLPLNLEDVQRIEILKGSGTRIHGHNAMAGVINIITRDADHTAVGGYAQYGDHDYYDVGAHGNLNTGDISNRVSASRRSSTGHVPEEPTDFDVKTFLYKGDVKSGKQRFQLGLGYADKDFGAYRFYSDIYPNQREQTETLLVHTSADLKAGGLEIIPKVFWRRHHDQFDIEILKEWYRNDHQTDSCGLSMDSRFASEWGTTAIGGEIALENIRSSNLGDHDRERSGLFLEHSVDCAERFSFTLGASAMNYSDWGWEWWPGAEVNVELSRASQWFVCLGRSFRIPTYTELYYDTPANQGNSRLKPEQAWTYDTGVRWREQGVGGSLGLFFRDEQDVIDWFRLSDEEPWKAGNIAENAVRGVEVALDFHPPAIWDTTCVSAVNMAYAYLDSDRDSGAGESKYVLDHLRHQVHASVVLKWLDALTQTFIARYEERMLGDRHMVVDTRLAYKTPGYEVFLDVTNLFDEQYVESGFSPMPGRWIVGGIKFHMDVDQ